MEKYAKIYVAGGQTLIGAAILRELERQGYMNIGGGPGEAPDLTDAAQVDAFFARTTPDYVFLAAGKSGGIGANQKYPAELMLDNLLVECHVIHNAYRHGVKKLLYLASSCSYPKHCPQPMRVESLMTGPLEPTNEAYAVAKIAGIKLCQAYSQQYGVNFICGIPANAFGPGDDFSLEDSHVIAALIRKMHEAKVLGVESVEIWGTGAPRREFIFSDDLADACIFVMREYSNSKPINLGSGWDLSIRELAELIKEVVGYLGELRFDTSKPDGMPAKLLDSSQLKEMGWQPRTPLRAALLATFEWFLNTKGESRTLVSDGSAPGRSRRDVRKAGERKVPVDIPLLEKKARQLRATCVQMAHDGRQGHLSSALSCISLLVALYYHWLRVSPDDPKNPDRDRFILSKGHGCTALYAVLADCGFFPKDMLSLYAQNDSPLPNHPCKYALPFLETSSGSLGHGLGIATGMLYGLRLDGVDARAVVLMSDGECNEGSVWEAAMFAAANRLDRLLAIVDYNGIQAVGRSDELMGYTLLEEKFQAFGWAARTIDGNNIYEIIETLDDFPFEQGRPSAIIANTGTGISFMDDQVLWHYRVPSDEDLQRALQELGETPIHRG